MTYKIDFLFFIFLLAFSTQAQVGIGTTKPHESALLEIHSRERGFLPPRMTIEQRNEIVNPTSGLFIFCTNCCYEGTLSLYSDGAWSELNPCTEIDIDGDGILNTADIDDDNDGIIDNMESRIINHFSFEQTISTFTNNDFENFNTVYGTNYWAFLDHGAINPWGGVFKNGNTNPANLSNPLQASNGDHYVIFHGSNYNNLRGEGLYNKLTTSIESGGRYQFEFDAYKVVFALGANTPLFDLDGNFRIYGVKSGQTIPAFSHTDGITTAQIEAHPLVFDFLGQTDAVSSSSSWNNVSVNFTATDNYDEILIIIERVSGTGSSTASMLAVDNFNCSRDTDGDGLFDHQDIDSDGDGCSDAYEAGATNNTDVDFQFPKSGVGTNGLSDALETTPGNGEINYTPINDYFFTSVNQLDYCDIQSPIVNSGLCDPNDQGAFSEHINLAPYLTTSLTDYQNASNGDLVVITEAEFDIINALPSFTRKGAQDFDGNSGAYSASSSSRAFIHPKGVSAPNQTYVAFASYSANAGDVRFLLTDNTYNIIWRSEQVSVQGGKNYFAIKTSGVSINKVSRLGMYSTFARGTSTAPHSSSPYRYIGLNNSCSASLTSTRTAWELGCSALVTN
jgi:hypothetical protein